MNETTRNAAPSQQLLYSRGQVYALAFMALVGLGIAASPASAEDRKIYPGTFCQPQYDSHGARFVYGSNGQISNTSNISGYVVCPIVRDDTQGKWETWSVSMNDQHPTQDIRCTLNVVTHYGRIAYSKTVASSGTGYQRETEQESYCGWGQGCIGRPTEQAANTPDVMRCVIPGRSPSGRSSTLFFYSFTE